MTTKEIMARLGARCKDNEVEWRVGQCGITNGKAWAKILCYITARAAMTRLDQVLGIENWKSEYEFINIQGNDPKSDIKGVICKLSVRINGEWITKQDGGDFTDIEAFKGGISDALKRAAVSFGMARDLYDLKDVFALTSLDKKDGYTKAKTKDGSVFYWKAPSLLNMTFKNNNVEVIEEKTMSIAEEVGIVDLDAPKKKKWQAVIMGEQLEHKKTLQKWGFKYDLDLEVWYMNIPQATWSTNPKFNLPGVKVEVYDLSPEEYE